MHVAVPVTITTLWVLPHVLERLLACDAAYLAYLFRIRQKRLDFTHATVEHGHDHMCSGGPDLSRVLRQIEIPPGSRILDLGSGKGAACFTFAEYGFKEIVGLELSPDLIQIAEMNAARLHAPVQFLCGDAATFTDLDRFTHVYLFNPFPASVVTTVLHNLEASWLRCPRPLTVIYKYPGIPPVQPSARYFVRRIIRLPRSHPFYIYCSSGCGYVTAMDTDT